MKNLLIVAYHFPPAGGRGAAGSLRISKFSKYFPASGWRPVVLTVKESCYEENLTIDPSLLREVSADLSIVRTRVFHPILPLFQLKNRLLDRLRRPRGGTSQNAGGGDSRVRRQPDAEISGWQKFKDGITDLLKVPDEVGGWLPPAVIAGRTAIRENDVDVILATGRPWTSLVVGAALKKLTGKKLVVDFRDPWTTNPFRIQPSWLKDRIEKRLEHWVVESADLVIANTDNLRLEFIERFGDEMRDRCITVLNGFDSEEFSSLTATEDGAAPNNVFVVLHAGVLYGKRDPKSFVDGVSLLKEAGDLDGVNLRIDLLGDIKLHYDLKAYIAEKCLEDVIILRGQVSYQESIKALAKCDAALLLQPGTMTQIPSKLYEYIGLRKRILTVAPTDSAVSRMVEDNGLGGVADPGSPEAVARIIKTSLEEWQQGKRPAYLSDGALMARFDIRHGVQRLSAEIDRIVA